MTREITDSRKGLKFPLAVPILLGMETKVVAERIRAGRVALGLSQVGLAAILNVADDTVSRWERGVQDPKWSEICALKTAGIDLTQCQEEHRETE